MEKINTHNFYLYLSLGEAWGERKGREERRRRQRKERRPVEGLRSKRAIIYRTFSVLEQRPTTHLPRFT